jgi:hypothetical protein
MRSYTARLISLGTAAVLTTALAAGCSSSGGTSGGTKPPILIGASLSLTGDFSADGQAFQKGYDLWVHDVNAVAAYSAARCSSWCSTTTAAPPRSPRTTRT